MALFRMTSITSRLALAAAMALGLGLYPIIALATETEKYPIWWSPTLELESLDKVDDRLRRPFGRGFDEGLPLFKGEGVDQVVVGAKNCISLERLLDDGYWGLGRNNHEIGLFFLAQCGAIRMIAAAKPAKVSFVSEFIMTTEALDYLPAMVELAISGDWLSRQYRANEMRISLARFEAEFGIELNVLSEFKIEGTSEGWFFDVEIVARADLNHDGPEDLLVIAGADATEGHWGTTRLFLLSRDTADGVLWVVDADKELCPDYRPCDAHYDEPAALR